MINSVDEYLSLLKKALSGCDAAVVQDAVSDAEEHLRTALSQAYEANPNISEADAIRPIVDKYGSPEEVAAAYRQMEIRVPSGLRGPVSAAKRSLLFRFFGVFAEPKAWGALLYMLLALTTGIIYFTWVVTGISVCLQLIVLIVGLPLLILFLLSVRFLGFVEGHLVETLLGVRMPRRQRFWEKKTGLWQNIKNLFSERNTWTTIAYSIMQLPLGIIYFTLFVSLISLSIYFIGMPISTLVFHQPAYFVISETDYRALTWTIPFSALAGVLLMTATMHLAKLVGRMHGSIAKFMLVSHKV
jgi:hypothetical protein